MSRAGCHQRHHAGEGVQIQFFSNCNHTLIEQRVAGVWVRRLKHNLAGRSVDPNSLRHDRVDRFDRHAAGQATVLGRHFLIARVQELVSH